MLCNIIDAQPLSITSSSRKHKPRFGLLLSHIDSIADHKYYQASFEPQQMISFNCITKCKLSCSNTTTYPSSHAVTGWAIKRATVLRDRKPYFFQILSYLPEKHHQNIQTQMTRASKAYASFS